MPIAHLCFQRSLRLSPGRYGNLTVLSRHRPRRAPPPSHRFTGHTDQPIREQRSLKETVWPQRWQAGHKAQFRALSPALRCLCTMHACLAADLHGRRPLITCKMAVSEEGGCQLTILRSFTRLAALEAGVYIIMTTILSCTCCDTGRGACVVTEHA